MARARGAVSAIFFLNGFLAALWVAHIPVITARTETSHEQLGGLLLLLGGSAFVGMQVSGHALDRFGSRTTTLVAATLLCPVMIGPAVASNTVALAVALALERPRTLHLRRGGDDRDLVDVSRQLRECHENLLVVAFAVLCTPAALEPVLNSAEQVARWRAGGGGACDVMVDTGMNRLGLRIEDVFENPSAAD